MNYGRGIYLFLFILRIPGIYGNMFAFDFKNVKVLESNQVKDFRTSPQLRVLYHYKEDLPRLRSFFREFEKSAEYLQVYGVLFGVCDCSTSSSYGNLEVCKEDLVEHNIYTYRHGNSLLKLELQTMFDVNSIMSNVLQLAMLQDVPILQTKESIQDLEYKLKGNKNMILSYQRAIGTYEHRIFMEVAYAYLEEIQFAVSTDRQALADFSDFSDNVAIWYLDCKNVIEKDDPCQKSLYHGNIDLTSLVLYVRTLLAPAVFHIPGDGNNVPYAQDSMNVLYLYHLAEHKDDVFAIAEAAANAMKGLFCVVTVSMEAGRHIPYDYMGVLPAALYKIRGEKTPRTMPSQWSLEKVLNFAYIMVEEQNKRTIGVKPSSGEAIVEDEEEEDETENVYSDDEPPIPQYDLMQQDFGDPDVEAVETQDDQVAESVFRSRPIPLDLDLVPSLNLSSFPSYVREDHPHYVLFYLPFDDKSMAVLRTYGDAARILEKEKHSYLTRVDCHDWMEVCQDQNITIYPTIRIYEKGRFSEYKDHLNSKQIVNSVQLVKHKHGVELSTEKEIQMFIDGQLPNGEAIESEVTFLALMSPSDPKTSELLKFILEYNQKTESNKLLIGFNKNDAAIHVAKHIFDRETPVLSVVRMHDEFMKFSVFEGKIDFKDDLEEFLRSASVPIMAEVTSTLFPMLFKQGKPLVIAFLDDSDTAAKVKNILVELQKSGSFKNLIFCWMKADKEEKSMGYRILKKYDAAGEVPAISFVVLSEGTVHNFKKTEFSKESVNSWLLDILIGDEKESRVNLPSGDWKPQKEAYNFLGMMDQERLRRKGISQPSDLQTFNEQGIGFDADGNEIINMENPSSNPAINDIMDDEIREELLNLKSSRLYHHIDKKKPVSEGENNIPLEGDSHTHEEL